MSNLAYVRARIAALDRSSPELNGEKPVEASPPKDIANFDDWVSLRITVRLCLMGGEGVLLS